MAAFMPGASPPLVRIAMCFMVRDFDCAAQESERKIANPARHRHGCRGPGGLCGRRHLAFGAVTDGSADATWVRCGDTMTASVTAALAGHLRRVRRQLGSIRHLSLKSEQWPSCSWPALPTRKCSI